MTRFNGAATLSLRKQKILIGQGYERLAALQWGRNFIVAETRRRSDIAGSIGLASMGPQLYRCGNMPYRDTALERGFLASMGPQLYRCGNKKKAGIALAGQIQLQWGRNFIVAETHEMLLLHHGTT